jgi:hypothetical protein
LFARNTIANFLLIGATAGVLSALGVIFVEQGIFVAGDRLVAITPAIALSLAIALIVHLVRSSLRPAHAILIPVAVYVSWYLAVQAGANVANYVHTSVAFIIAGIVGAGLLSLLLSPISSTLRQVQVVIVMCVVGGVGAVPFIISDQLGAGDTAGFFVLFVFWQAVDAAAIGYFLKRA